MGTSGMPASSAATTATHVSSVASAQTATRSAPSNAAGERRGGRAQLAVAQALAGDGHGRLRLPLVERRQQRGGHARLIPRLADA